MGLTIGSDTHPSVLFVRMADTGLMLDAASRTSTSGELNTETQRAQRLGTVGQRKRSNREWKALDWRIDSN